MGKEHRVTKYKSIRLKYLASINDEVLSEETKPDLEIKYIDISSVNSSGEINEIAAFKFSEAPSRARRIVRKGDIIISTVRTYLKAIAAIDENIENLIVSTGFAVVRPKRGILHPDFCKYIVTNSNFIDEVQMRSVGVSYPAINASDLGDIFVPAPSYETQLNISRYLSQEIEGIEKLIKAKEQLINLLSEKRTALVTQAVTRGVNPNVKLKDSRIDFLGEVPQHWEILQMKFLASEPMKYGANEAGLDDNPNNPRFIRITDINTDGTLKEDTFKSLEIDVARDYLLEEGDILLARSGATVGKAFLYKSEWGVCCFAGYLIRMRCNLDRLLPEFLILVTESNYYWSQIHAESIQATIQNFSGEKYASMKIILPDLVEQKEIINFLTVELGKIDELRKLTMKTISILKERRSALVTAAVTGQLDIP